jgi:hypothetical protein
MTTMRSSHVFLLALHLLATSTLAADVEYVTDLSNRFIVAGHGWGEIGIDTCAHATGHKPLPLQIGDKTFARGIGSHAISDIRVLLDGEYETFEATIGLQPLPGGTGSVVFQIFVDDEKQFDSGLMKADSAAKPVAISVQGVQELRLVVTDGGDGINCDCANWADARLTRAAGAATKPPQWVDIASFARLVTSDPQRNDGARAARVQEYRQEDVYLERQIRLKDDGSLPSSAAATHCIGLNWLERRPLRELGITFKSKSPPSSPQSAAVQYWLGPTAWQGEWKPLQGQIEQIDDQWRIAVDWKTNPELRNGTRKIRWIVPESAKVAIERLSATTPETTTADEFVIETEAAQKGPIRLGVYNGEFEQSSKQAVTIAAGESARVQLKYLLRPRWIANQTLLRFTMPDGSGFSVAIGDVLLRGGVYVRDRGVFVAPAKGGLTLASYKKQIDGRETMLQQVRRLPDQTFEQAMRKVHHFQEGSPVMLSLACDNSKFVVAREGQVDFPSGLKNAGETGLDGKTQNLARIAVRFGSGKNANLTRRLDGDWLPAPAITVDDNGIRYQQRAMVVPAEDAPAAAPGWLVDRPVCVIEYQISSTTGDAKDASVMLSFIGDLSANRPAKVEATASGAIVTGSKRLLASIEHGNGLKADIEGAAVHIHGNIPAGNTATFRVLLPGWAASADELKSFSTTDPLPKLKAYWENILSHAMQVDVPDALLMNVIRASQVHCLIAARNEEAGKRIAPWIAAVSYGPLESEANSIIRGMDLFGHGLFAQRSLDYFISRYDPAGFLTTGYTLMGTGWHLQTLGQHYQLTRDSEWLKSVAPKVATVCDWITRQRAKTKFVSDDSTDTSPPEAGLAPPGVMADWSNYAYYFCLNGYYCAGLREAATALSDIRFGGAEGWLKEASDYADAIRRAYHATQALMPVYPLRDGTFTPGYPSQVHTPGPSNNFFPGEDGNRSWCYDVELGSHHLVPQGVLKPASADVDSIMNHMEDVQFFADGWFDYPSAENEKDPFNFGGFAKVQPYYCRNGEIYAMRDEVKPFIRSYFNTLPTLLNTEVLSLQEHFHGAGAWNKTHETGYFLQQTRFMLVMEHDDALWLAPLITNKWLKNGMSVGVQNAPTRFGNVSYRIASSVDKGFIDVSVEAPTRTPPREIVVRLRHPLDRPIQRVTVNDIETSSFDSADGTIHLAKPQGQIRIRAFFAK